MTQQEMFQTIHDKFQAIAEEQGLLLKPILITSRALTPTEAIGDTKRSDYPILTGKEVMLQADFDGAIGQAFTDAPASFVGTLVDVLKLDLTNDTHSRGLFFAALNAVMCRLGLAKGTVHCKNDGPENCAIEIVSFLRKNYGTPKIALIGYQPAMFSHLAEIFPLKVLDLDPKNIGQKRFGVTVGHGFDDFEDTTKWADIILCTGSAVCNGSLAQYLDMDKDVWFFGTSLSGTAALLGLNRLCFCETV